MDAALVLSDASRNTAGILLLTLVAVETGGLYMLRILRGRVRVTPFQQAFARAGHAHAGVLVTLSLVIQLWVDAAELEGATEAVARSGVPIAAILMPAGFFFASMGRNVVRPNRFIVLTYAGAVSLTVGLITLGIGLLTA
jgi:hypothetical protein